MITLTNGAVYDDTKPFSEQEQGVYDWIETITQTTYINREFDVCLSGIERDTKIEWADENAKFIRTIDYVNAPNNPAFLARRGGSQSIVAATAADQQQTIEI